VGVGADVDAAVEAGVDAGDDVDGRSNDVGTGVTGND
jgi:hypothetical protein